METLLYSRVGFANWGLLFVVLRRNGLAMIEFDAGRPEPSAEVVTRDGDGKKIRVTGSSSLSQRPLRKELNEYFAAERQDSAFLSTLRGTDFQKRCWRALLESLRSNLNYRDIAQRVGTTGYRAVGMATTEFRLSFPSTRHLSNGTLCGYGGGLDMKRYLLRLEARPFAIAA